MSNDRNTNTNHFHGPVDTSGASFGSGPITNNWVDGKPVESDEDVDWEGEDVVHLPGHAFGSGIVTNQ